MNATQQIRERTLESVVDGDGDSKLSCWKQTEKRKINVFCLKKTIPTKYQLNSATAKCHDRQKNHNNLWKKPWQEPRKKWSQHFSVPAFEKLFKIY